jgi:hypothetical protein
MLKMFAAINNKFANDCQECKVYHRRRIAQSENVLDYARKVIEVEHVKKWTRARVQVLIAGLSYPEREKWIYLFGECSSPELIVSKCKMYGISVVFC